MTEQEQINELISEYTFRTEKGTFFKKDLNQFKKELFKILLPWRDFEKEKPEEGEQFITFYEDSGDKMNFFESIRVSALDSVCSPGDKWIYKEELLNTLPEEE